MPDKVLSARFTWVDGETQARGEAFLAWPFDALGDAGIEQRIAAPGRAPRGPE